jgi:biopolymer transport protein ExbB/TolQ/pimeloyl-ACP methyl ester carboxylesterase
VKAALFSLAFALGGVDAADAPPVPASPELDRVVDAAGLRLHLHCEGQGSPTVVFDAGAGNDGSTWRTVLPGVARVTRACAYDRAGLGYSGPGRKPRTSDRMATELRALLMAAEIPPPFVLVGHSAGGLNVRLFADEHLDEVAGLVLVDATPPAAGERLWSRFSEQERQQQRERMQRGPDGWDYDSFLASMKQASRTSALGELPLVVLTRGREELPQPGVSAEEAARRSEIWSELQAELPRLSSNSRHVVVPEARHFIHWDAPALVIRAVRDVVMAARTGRSLEGALPAAPSGNTVAPAHAATAPPAPSIEQIPASPTSAPGQSPATALSTARASAPPQAVIASTTTLWERWQQGGLVMYAILGLSALAVATLLDHLRSFRGRRAQDETLFEQADALWSAGKFAELERLCQQSAGVGARVVLAIVRHRRQRYDDVNAVAGEIASAALREQLRRAAWLAVAATLSPLLGLFGTVTGMVEAFDAVAASGTMGDASLVAAGISQALVTTVAGLLVGIPALGARHFVFARIQGAAAALESQLNERLRRWLLAEREPS